MPLLHRDSGVSEIIPAFYPRCTLPHYLCGLKLEHAAKN